MNRTRYFTVLWICNPTPYHPGHRPILFSTANHSAESSGPIRVQGGFQPLLDLHVKIEFVYLSDFSATASITEAAHLSLFIVVTRSLVPHIHLIH